MTKERLEHLRLMADQCENLDPTDTRELIAEIERLQDIEAAAKECPLKWKCSKCGAWVKVLDDDSLCPVTIDDGYYYCNSKLTRILP